MVEMNTGGSPSVLRALNLRQTLRFVREKEEVSKAQIIRNTGLSRPTINEIVDELVGADLVVPSVKRSRGGGSLLRFHKEAGVLFGVDLEVGHISILMANLAGEVIGRTNTRSPFGISAAATVVLVREMMDTLLGEASLTADDVHCTVFTVPGAVAPLTGKLSLVPSLPELEGADLPALMDLTSPVLVENDMQAAVRAESWRGVALGRKNVAYLGANDGIGAALQIDGQLYAGAHGMAGELGYLSPPSTVRMQGPNEKGPLEAAAGVAAFLKRSGTVVEENPHSSLFRFLQESGKLELKDIAVAATQQDAVALRLISEEARLLSHAAVALVLVLDPEMLIIGGQIAELGEIFVGMIRNMVEQQVPGVRTVVVRDALGKEAAALGAINLALQASDEIIETAIYNR